MLPRLLAPTWLVLALGIAAPPAWLAHPSGATARLRAVSVVSARVAWASGNGGTVLRTVDGGASWTTLAVPGSADLDFRDVEAFDAETATVLAIGPGEKSRIYRTSDGGRTWMLQFANTDPKAFYDAIAFWDASTGLAIGDPVSGRFSVVRTVDAGRTWTPVPAAQLPPARDGEGAFAASGTCLVVHGSSHAWFATGSAGRGRVFRSADQGRTWDVAETPIVATPSSAGIFSLAFSDSLHGIAVGGDYREERASGDNVARTADGGKTWTLDPPMRLRGFRSAVAFVPGTGGREVIAVGPAGTDRSTDGGTSWTAIGEEGFHALGISRDGTVAWAVGEAGRIATLALRER